MDQTTKKIAGIVGIAIVCIAGVLIYQFTADDDLNSTMAENPTGGQNAILHQNDGPKSQPRNGINLDEDFDITKLDPEVQKKVDLSNQTLRDLFGIEDIENLHLSDPDVVALLLEEYGSIKELYASLSNEKRLELIDYLYLTSTLRDELEGILDGEENSETRAFMLARVMPDTSFSDPDNLMDTTDREMIAILDKTTETPIDGAEWITRMNLANLVDNEYALTWTRDAADAHPDNVAVNMAAAVLTLKIGSSVDSVSGGERERAQNYLMSNLSTQGIDTTNYEQRIDAYMSLYWSSDTDNTLEFYRNMLEVEDNQRARGILNQMIDMMESS